MPIASVTAGALIDPTTFGNAVVDELNHRGYKAQAIRSAIQSGVGTGGTDLTDLTVTFTAAANRRYIALASVTARQRTAAGLVYLFIVADGNNVGGGLTSVTADGYCSLEATSKVFTPAAGSVTVKLQGRTSNNTVDFHGNGFDSFVQVLDIGPSA
jgi:hypothetical protein